MKITDEMFSQGIELIKFDEKELYERLGISLTLWETLQGPDLSIRDVERPFPPTEGGLYRRVPSEGRRRFRNEYLSQLCMKERQLTEALRLLALREDLIKKGRKYFRKFRRKLFRKICVEKEACKWTKEILGDTKSLLREIIPLVGIALGYTVPAITITIAIIIVKWGIIKFCKCPKP